MKDFVYSYPVKVYFGEKAAAKALPSELAKWAKRLSKCYPQYPCDVGKYERQGGKDRIL